MVVKKGRKGEREILDKLLQLSKEGTLCRDSYALLLTLEAHLNEHYLENQSLKEDIASDSEYISSLQKELQEIKQKDKLSTTTSPEEVKQISKEAEESKFHAKQLEKGIQYLRCKLDEAKTDKELLNEEILQLREETETLRLQLNDEGQREDQNILEQKLEERQEELHLFEKEIEALKQGVLRTIQEVKELMNRCEKKADSDQVAEKNEEEQKRLFTDQQKHIKRLQEELENKQKRYQELESLSEEVERKLSHSKMHEGERLRIEDRCKELEKNLQEVFQKGEEAAKHRMELEQKIRRLEEEKKVTEKNLHNCLLEKKNLEEQLALSGQKIHESEEETKIAQQHLAKKLKDYATVLNENEEMKKEALSQQGKINELRLALQSKQNIEIALQEQLKKASKFSTRVNELEGRCQNLQEIEERYQKLQEMIGHFQQLLEADRKSQSP